VQWSPNIAYAVGLLATDGCLSIDGRHIEITSKDIQQLRNFMKCIGKKVSITKKVSGYTGRQITRIQFSDVTLYRFLVSIGLSSGKTKTLGKLAIPDLYFFDFLRGHHDGDGSFYSYFDPRWKTSYLFYLAFVSASEAHISWVRETLLRLLGVRGHIGKSKLTTVIQLKYGKRESLLILRKMYSGRGVVCLARKRLKIQRALRIVGESLSTRRYRPR